jgi:hypothetical protein
MEAARVRGGRRGGRPAALGHGPPLGQPSKGDGGEENSFLGFIKWTGDGI